MIEFESTKEMLGRSRRERKETYIKLKAAEAEIVRRGECMEDMYQLMLRVIGRYQYLRFSGKFDSDGNIKPYVTEAK